jgi:AcrR family transcriptional regulator
MTTSVRPGLRERQRAETHRMIRRAAYQLAAAHGVGAVSVQAVCELAGVSPRTFFNHFRSKEEALVPDLPDFPEAAVDAFVAGDGPDLVTALESLLGQHLLCVLELDVPDEDPLACQRLVLANPELLPRALAVFGAIEQRLAVLVARRTGLPADDLFCTVAALTAASAMRAAFDALARQEGDRADAARQLIPAAFAALRRLVTPASPRP